MMKNLMMKSWAVPLATLLMALTMVFFACARAEGTLTPDQANEFLQEYTGRILDPEDEISCFLSTGDDENLAVTASQSQAYLETLRKVTLKAADISAEPDGERAVLTWPDHCQFRFFLGEAPKNYVQLIVYGEKEESILLQAVMPEDCPFTASGLLTEWARTLAAVQAPQNGLHADIQPVTASPEWVKNLPAAQDESVTQLFVVAGLGMDKTTATVSMHQRDENGQWQQILSTPGFVGKNGLCLDADHREGCGQTPVGVYRFNKAFGIAPDPGCAIPYFQVDENTYWSGDPDRQYNRMVDIRDVPELLMDDSKHIVDYEYQYQYCLNISFNEDGTPGRGSAIFLHCFGPLKPYTGGCVALPENIMKLVMQQVREDCVVVIDTLENLGGSL